MADPFVTVWRTLPGDLVLMGSVTPHAVSLGQVDWRSAEDTRATELRRAGIFNDRDLVRHYIIGGDPLRQYVSGADRNTDKHPIIEFNAPRNLYAATDVSNLSSVFDFLGEQNLEVPVQGFFQLTDSEIAATAFGLRIDVPGPDIPADLHVRWLTSWQLLDEDAGPVFKMGSARVLTWKEGSSEYYIQASSHAEELPESKLKALLSDLIAVKEEGWHEVLLPGGDRGVWLAVQHPQNQRVQLAIAWNCMNDLNGFNRYALIVNLPDPGRDSWNKAMTGQANRFHCT